MSARIFRGGIPNHRGGTAALRRLERTMSIAAGRARYVPEAINAWFLAHGAGWRLHPTKGMRKDHHYKTGNRLEPMTRTEMVAVFWQTIERAQKIGA